MVSIHPETGKITGFFRFCEYIIEVEYSEEEDHWMQVGDRFSIVDHYTKRKR